MKTRFPATRAVWAVATVLLLAVGFGCSRKPVNPATSAAGGSTAARRTAAKANGIDALPAGMANPNPTMESRPMSVPRR
jgi:hypothetical protein